MWNGEAGSSSSSLLPSAGAPAGLRVCTCGLTAPAQLRCLPGSLATGSHWPLATGAAPPTVHSAASLPAQQQSFPLSALVLRHTRLIRLPAAPIWPWHSNVTSDFGSFAYVCDGDDPSFALECISECRKGWCTGL